MAYIPQAKCAAKKMERGLISSIGQTASMTLAHPSPHKTGLNTLRDRSELMNPGSPLKWNVQA